MATPKHWQNPFVPKPEKKEHPVVEELVNEKGIRHPLEHPAIMLKQDTPIREPRYNKLYDGIRSQHAIEFFADYYANGTITTIAATQVLGTVNLTLPSGTQSPNWRLEQWPGGTQLFLMIRWFSLGPQTASFATQGEIDTLFISRYGAPVPLGVLPNNAFTNLRMMALIPTPYTDSGDQAGLGQLSVTLNSGATVGTYSYQIGLTAVYMIPELKPYNKEYQSEPPHHSTHH